MKTQSIAFVYFISLLLISILHSCTTKTKKRIDITNIQFPNEKYLMVEKTNEDKTSIGVFTKNNYGTKHSFAYKFSVDNGNINWNGGSGEPKHILFCKDTTFVHSLKEKSVNTQYTDSLDNTIKYKHHYEIQDIFEKHIDERYFFKFFGNEYWVEISPENYMLKKESCDEYAIPNDNELSLTPVITDKQKTILMQHPE